MARKSTDTINLRTDDTFAARLETAAKALGTSRSAYIRRSVLEQIRRDSDLLRELAA
jgi:hypothetical protein